MTDKARSTLQSLVLGLLVIFLVSGHQALLFSAIVLLITIILKRKELNILAFFLERVGRFIGTALSSIILALCYIFIIIPYGLMYRTYINKSNYHYYFQRQKITYYIQSEKRDYNSEYFKRLW